MGVVYKSKDGVTELRPGARLKVVTPTGAVNAIVESVYEISVPFEIQIVENPTDPVESPLKAGDYLLVRVIG